MVQIDICHGIWYWKGLRQEWLDLRKVWQNLSFQRICISSQDGYKLSSSRPTGTSSNTRCTHLPQDWEESQAFKSKIVIPAQLPPNQEHVETQTAPPFRVTSPQYLQFYFGHAQNCFCLSNLASYSHLIPVRITKELPRTPQNTLTVHQQNRALPKIHFPRTESKHMSTPQAGKNWFRVSQVLDYFF